VVSATEDDAPTVRPVDAGETTVTLIVQETDGEYARRTGYIVDPPNAELDAMVGRTYSLSTSMRTWAADEDECVADDVLGPVPHTIRRSAKFVIRARFGDRLLGIHASVGYLLRPDWLREVTP
jgi:hypothetical protein